MSWPEAFASIAYALASACITLVCVGGAIILYTLKRLFDEDV